MPTFATVETLESLRASGNSTDTVVRYANAGHDVHDVDSGAPEPVWTDVRRWLREVAVYSNGDQ